jgi:NAD+ synthase (glutamine-hydrolysing)
LAKHAWGDAARGDWPPIIPKAERIVYDLPAIKRWFALFLERFFAANHFKTPGFAQRNEDRLGRIPCFSVQ